MLAPRKARAPAKHDVLRPVDVFTSHAQVPRVARRFGDNVQNHLRKSQLIGLRVMSGFYVKANQLAFLLPASEQGLRMVVPTDPEKCRQIC